MMWIEDSDPKHLTAILLLYGSAELQTIFEAGQPLLSVPARVLIANVPDEDPKTLIDAVADATDIFEYTLERLNGLMATPKGRCSALLVLLPILRAAKDPITRELYVARTAEALGVTRESIIKEVS